MPIAKITAGARTGGPVFSPGEIGRGVGELAPSVKEDGEERKRIKKGMLQKMQAVLFLSKVVSAAEEEEFV
jgi:hypothetical protein